MKPIVQKTSPVIPADDLLNQARSAFRRQDYEQVWQLLRPQVEADTAPADHYLLAGSALAETGRLRQARYISVRGALRFSQDSGLLNQIESLFIRLNGRFIFRNYQRTVRPRKSPSISLVLIVKNEEANLARCLASFQDIVQEIIVVDTGSTDRTVEIAQSFQARVEYFPWTGDFAAARNASLRYATCDWILRTDADEYIEDSEKPRLLQAVNSGDAEIYLGLTESTMPDGRTSYANNVRLIKNHLGVVYEYPIHETIAPSAVRLGLTQANTNIRFVHTGYHTALGDYHAKLQRNIDICERALQTDPTNIQLMIIKGTASFEISPGKGVQIMEDALGLLREDTLATQYLSICYTYLGGTYASREDLAGVRRMVDLILADFSGDPGALYFAGELSFFILCDLTLAFRIFRFIRVLHGVAALNSVSYAETCDYDRLEQYLIETAVMIGENENALRMITERAKKAAGTQKLPAREYERLQQAWQSKDFGTLVDIGLKYPVRPADANRWIARGLIKAGRWNEAADAIIQACASSGCLPQDYFDLAICRQQAKRYRYCHWLLEAYRKAGGSNASGYNLDAVLAVQERKPAQALAYAENALKMDPYNQAIRANFEQIARLNGVDPQPVLTQAGSESAS